MNQTQDLYVLVLENESENGKSNNSFQCSQWLQELWIVVIMPFQNCIEDNYFISITETQMIKKQTPLTSFFKSTVVGGKVESDVRACFDKIYGQRLLFETNYIVHIVLLSFKIVAQCSDKMLDHCAEVFVSLSTYFLLFQVDLALFTFMILPEFGSDKCMVAYEHITNQKVFRGKYFSSAHNMLNNPHLRHLKLKSSLEKAYKQIFVSVYSP